MFFPIFLFFAASYCFSQIQEDRVTVEITNVVINNGKVYLAIFANAEQFRKEEPFIAVELASNSTVLIHELSLPRGEYVVSAFQDTNDNKALDYGLFGIPKEMVAISNYHGKGLPTKEFNKQKIMINGSTGKVSIGLYKF